jgi:diamine N-acetyltransferase
LYNFPAKSNLMHQNKIEIRIADEALLPIINDIAHRTWPSTFGAIISKQQLNYMLDWMYSIPSLKDQIKNGHVFLLAKLNEEYLGYASYEVNYKGIPNTKLHKIYILPEAQGKGIGKTLLDEVELVARKNQNTSVLLNVNKHNKAVDFYEKIGFKVIGTEDIDIGNGFLMEDKIMEKKL